MAKIIVFIASVLLIYGCKPSSVSGIGLIDEAHASGNQMSDVDSVTASQNVVIAPKPIRPTLVEIYNSQAGLTELTGNNDGAHIAAYHRAAGLNCPVGCPYCSSGVKWTFDSAGVATPIKAWSPSAHNKNNVVYQDGRFFKDPRPGDVITIFYQNLGRIGHTGFFDARINEDVVQTFEFNTNSTGSRDGQGNFFKKRPLKTLHSISRWTED